MSLEIDICSDTIKELKYYLYDSDRKLTIGERLTEYNDIKLVTIDDPYSFQFIGLSSNDCHSRIHWVLIGDFLGYTNEELSDYVESLNWGIKNIFISSQLSTIIDISSELESRHIYVFDLFNIDPDYLCNYIPTDSAMLDKDFSKWILKMIKRGVSKTF